jgi:hypothetical protein
MASGSNTRIGGDHDNDNRDFVPTHYKKKEE